MLKLCSCIRNCKKKLKYEIIVKFTEPLTQNYIFKLKKEKKNLNKIDLGEMLSSDVEINVGKISKLNWCFLT